MEQDAARSAGKFSYERVAEEGEKLDNSECSVFVVGNVMQVHFLLSVCIYCFSQTDIARGVTDDLLKDKFREFGNVQEAFVVKNKFTGETKGI